MIDRFRKTLQKQGLLDDGQKLLVACSGGADSTALLHLLHQCGCAIEVAHVNYQLRGKASDEGEAFVDQLCKDLDLPFHVKCFDTQVLAEAAKVGIQELARTLRYEWFESLAKTQGLTFIATAHHQDDKIETYLQHVLRGSSLSGFSSIPARRANVIRPLLDFTKKEILSFIKENKLAYVEDESNQKLDYTRNKIRHQLIPMMGEIHEGFEKNVLRQMQMFEELNLLYQGFMENMGRRVLSADPGGLSIDLAQFQDLAFKRLLIMSLAPQYGFELKRVDEWLDLVDSQNGKAIYSATHRVIKQRASLLITSLPSASDSKEILIHEGQETLELESLWLMSYLDFSEELLREAKTNKDENTAYFDAHRLSFPLVLRRPKSGDRFRALGMDGSQLLSDFFTQKKISQPEKEEALVLESAGEIIWIVGMRSAHTVRLTEETTRVLRLVRTKKA
ncbi:MAG: tRNA lysidine(34) synthetase TilS [Flavobacteriales bacterium]|nr:tRNA lysidine(34) synthetase TilS [Flavobacteriales bacterium]